MVHTVAEAKRYIQQVGQPGVAHINGDVYHMQSEESHIGEAIVDAGDMLANLHFADSNRSALGEGSMDVCTIIRALYLIGHNREGRFVSFRTAGTRRRSLPGDVWQAEQAQTDALVSTSIQYFIECEEIVRSE